MGEKYSWCKQNEKTLRISVLSLVKSGKRKKGGVRGTRIFYH